MAFQSIWYDTGLPNNMIDDVIKEFEHCIDIHNSKITNGLDTELKEKTRKSKNGWITTNHWISGYIWYFVNKANNENFRYDLRNIDNENIQYTVYDPGEYYKWHSDTSVVLNYYPQSIGSSVLNGDFVRDQSVCDKELSRKLSFSLQLSDEDDYEGGELQFMDDDDQLYTAPKKKGTIIIFDSRVKHRVRKIKNGTRKSLVGWVVGPRWK